MDQPLQTRLTDSSVRDVGSVWPRRSKYCSATTCALRLPYRLGRTRTRMVDKKAALAFLFLLNSGARGATLTDCYEGGAYHINLAHGAASVAGSPVSCGSEKGIGGAHSSACRNVLQWMRKDSISLASAIAYFASARSVMANTFAGHPRSSTPLERPTLSRLAARERRRRERQGPRRPLQESLLYRPVS